MASGKGAEQPNQDVIHLTGAELNIQEIYNSATCTSCGAIAMFVGTTRSLFLDRPVLHLEYEAYEPMVQSELHRVVGSIRARWPMVRHVCIHHRLGVVPVGGASVAIAISSPHRRDAQEAVQFCIDALKANAPIWKKEVYDSLDSEWKENRECSWAKSIHNQ